MLEFHGDLCCWGQVKTLPMAASHSTPATVLGCFGEGMAAVFFFKLGGAFGVGLDIFWIMLFAGIRRRE